MYITVGDLKKMLDIVPDDTLCSIPQENDGSLSIYELQWLPQYKLLNFAHEYPKNSAEVIRLNDETLDAYYANADKCKRDLYDNALRVCKEEFEQCHAALRKEMVKELNGRELKADIVNIETGDTLVKAGTEIDFDEHIIIDLALMFGSLEPIEQLWQEPENIWFTADRPVNDIIQRLRKIHGEYIGHARDKMKQYRKLKQECQKRIDDDAQVTKQIMAYIEKYKDKIIQKLAESNVNKAEIEPEGDEYGGD